LTPLRSDLSFGDSLNDTIARVPGLARHDLVHVPRNEEVVGDVGQNKKHDLRCRGLVDIVSHLEPIHLARLAKIQPGERGVDMGGFAIADPSGRPLVARLVGGARRAAIAVIDNHDLVGMQESGRECSSP